MKRDDQYYQTLRHRMAILMEVDDERLAQIEQWGSWGDLHAPVVWLAIISKHVGKLAAEILDVGNSFFLHGDAAPVDGNLAIKEQQEVRRRRHASAQPTRHRLIVVAALCVAFVEWVDRNHPES